ncbi:hypothetical protein WICPIJ_003865, partial [Wickerhamomyces pijperi]
STVSSIVKSLSFLNNPELAAISEDDPAAEYAVTFFNIDNDFLEISGLENPTYNEMFATSGKFKRRTSANDCNPPVPIPEAA